MLAIAVSTLFGLVAFAALVQIHVAVNRGLERRRKILAELRSYQRRLEPRLKPKSLRPMPVVAAATWHSA